MNRTRRCSPIAHVVATLLPSAAFFLKLGRYAPARMLIEQGVAVALATDLNPGGGFTTSMPFVMTLACFGMNLTLEEALVGATINAAASIDRADTIGSLETGKQFDAVVVNGMLTDLIRVGGPVIKKVIKQAAGCSTSRAEVEMLGVRPLSALESQNVVCGNDGGAVARCAVELESHAGRRHGGGDRRRDGNVAAGDGDRPRRSRRTTRTTKRRRWRRRATG